MPPPGRPPSPDADQPTIDEARMRRALGLDRPPAASATPPAQQRPAQQRPEQARVRHRFVQDGEVPVEVVNARATTTRAEHAPRAARGEDVGALRAELRAEQQARIDAERSLAQAQAALQALRTQLAHAELAHAEALAAERRAREGAEAALRAATEARDAAEQRLHGAVEGAVPASPATVTDTAPARPATKRPRADKPAEAPPAPEREPEPVPVEWWVPGWKARQREG